MLESIEDQIAEHYVAPAPVKRICEWKDKRGGCTTPLAAANKETLCFRHLRLERTLKTMKSFNWGDEPAAPPKEPAPPKELRLCAVKDCHRKLQANNKSGRCAGHYLLQTGMQMKDGSIPRPLPIPPLEPIEPIEPLAPIQPLEPIEALPPIQPETKEEMTPVSEQTTTPTTAEDPKHFRICAVKDCNQAIGVHNASGRCTGHFYVKRGMVMKDGSIPKPHTPLSATMKRAKINNAAAGITGKNKHKKALPAPTVLPEAPVAVIQGIYPVVVCADDKLVSLKVPIDRLDTFLMKLPIEDKIRIVERELFGGA